MSSWGVGRRRRRGLQQHTGKKKNNVVLDTTALEELLAQVEDMGGSVEEAATQALSWAAKRIEYDMEQAVVKGKMPAGGKYWTGETERSIVRDTTVRKDGTTLWVPVGFDFDKPGAGGFLIVGTPWVEPVPELYYMFQRKKFMRDMQEGMWEMVERYMREARKKASS